MKTLMLFTLALTTTVLTAQNCGYYFLQNNKTITLGFYNKKGSLDGKLIYKISNVSKSGATVAGNVSSEYFDKKGKSYGQNTGKMKCTGGRLLMDMKMMMSPQQNSQFQNAEVEGKGSFLEYPSVLKVGQTLTDGHFDMDIKMEAGIPANVKMDITNRKVEAKESVTTPAGTWDAYKITYTTKTVINMGFAIPVKMDMTEWFVPDFGIVKTEHKMGKSELIAIE